MDSILMEKRIIILLRENPEITRKELSQKLNLTTDGMKYHLTKLRKQGRIIHEGATKAGRWIVFDSESF